MVRESRVKSVIVTTIISGFLIGEIQISGGASNNYTGSWRGSEHCVQDLHGGWVTLEIKHDRLMRFLDQLEGRGT